MPNFSIEQHTDALAQYLPGGRAFEAKFVAGSNLRDLLAGVAVEFQREEGYKNILVQDYIPDAGDSYLAEWERVLGIPNGCIPLSSSTDERLRNVRIMLGLLTGIETVADFESLAEEFGISVSVYPGSESVYPIANSRFAIIVEWDDIDSELSEYAPVIRCLFEQLLPETVLVYYRGFNRYAHSGEELMQAGEGFAQAGNRLF